jgi:cytoskeletal protein RodZ
MAWGVLQAWTRSYSGLVELDATSPGMAIERARESRGMTVADLSAATRLRQGLLVEIESDDFRGTGGDVYARGHLRAIATTLGLDADDLIAAYSRLDHTLRPPAI